jgi:hypothetical protein
VLVELITVESYWLTKEWISNCCLSNLDEKFISLYKNFSYNLIYWSFISWFIEILLRIEIFDRHEIIFFWSSCLRASLSLRFDLINIVFLIFEFIDLSTISKINKYEKNHFDLNKSSRLNDRKTTRFEINILMKKLTIRIVSNKQMRLVIESFMHEELNNDVVR